MKRYRTIISAIIVIAFLVGMAGCASLVKNSAASLSASKNFYEIALESCAELYYSGYINDDQKDDIIKAATIYQNAHNVAVDALIVYNATKDSNTKDALTIAMSRAIGAWDDVAALINSIKPNTVPEELGGAL